MGGQAYCLREHIARLEGSASRIDLKAPPEYERLVEIIKSVAQAGGMKDCLIRIVISRGPGGFSTNPYECPRSQLYVMAIKLKTPSAEAYEKGVTIISAPVPVKPPMFANIKSCDYLGNVLVKKAAIEAGVDYAVNWDDNGYLAEGSTENILLVTPEGELLYPGFDRVLKGVTISRTIALAETLIPSGLLKAVRPAEIDRVLAASCPEVMLTSTSMDVLPVTAWDGRAVGDGRPGPVTRRLLDLVRRDVAENREVLTPLFD